MTSEHEDTGIDRSSVQVDGPLGGDPVHREVRGSTLLLLGRLISLVANFVVQVMVVRYLQVAEYGAFAYALALSQFAQGILTLGLDRSVGRFVAIDDERRRYGRMLGTIVIAVGTVGILGSSIVALAWLAEPALENVVGDPLVVSVLVVMLALGPIQALDDILVSLLAIFAGARSIFVRRHVLSPILRLSIVGAMTLAGVGVPTLAAGYVGAAAIGALINIGIVYRVMRATGRLQHVRRSELEFPVRDLASYAIPGMSTDLVAIAINVLGVVILEQSAGAGAVAAFRVILPAAALNQFAMTSFATLFIPIASRLFARADHEALANLYWRTANWLAVISFPIFLLTFSLAEPVTVALYEERYRDSAPFLAILGLAYYLNAAFGFNGLALKVYGRLRAVVLISALTVMLSVGLNVLLVPAFGSAGAVAAMALSLVLFNLLKQVGLSRSTGIEFFPTKAVPLYASLAVTALAVYLLQAVLRPGLVVGVSIAAAGALVVLLLNRQRLAADETFPELRRIPLYGRIIGD